MPTIFSHALLPLAVGLGLGRNRVPPALLLAGMLAAVLPDADVIAFKLGIPYSDKLGHRGASHALLTALVVSGLACGVVARWRSAWAWWFLFFAMASHGLLDSLTDGGKGVALLWPWSDTRWFAGWRPIEVSPIGWSRFWSARGWEVVQSEFVWIWLPCAALTAMLLLWRASVPWRRS
ncbi:membrane protein [Chitinimonas prasina]|uniref:Membrane protein n=1 Tax=Chitinimonas prasina TaxID=1434937 RepID=A0ABQ5YEN7_9NEIS|nr:metal-dependent hydrolase [Chitinimonas prasina]GLR12098.1 membrane protein [Chitinimonas prasina]